MAIMVIPKIKIIGASALSSWGVIGFPSMTAWLGAMHALQRRLGFKVTRVGVVSHKFRMHAYKIRGGIYHSLTGELGPSDHKLQAPSFKEEAKCNLTVSLIVEFDGDIDADTVWSEIYKMKIASGDVTSVRKPIIFKGLGELETRNAVVRSVMPGYVLIERRDLVQKACIDGRDPMDAVMDYIKLYHIYDPDGWYCHRKTRGWIVPISTGFHAISEKGIVPSQRDPSVPHRFAESVTTLGEFVMPWRFKVIDEMLWRYAVEGNLYICKGQTI